MKYFQHQSTPTKQNYSELCLLLVIDWYISFRKFLIRLLSSVKKIKKISSKDTQVKAFYFIGYNDKLVC